MKKKNQKNTPFTSFLDFWVPILKKKIVTQNMLVIFCRKIMKLFLHIKYFSYFFILEEEKILSVPLLLGCTAGCVQQQLQTIGKLNLFLIWQFEHFS